MQVMSGYVSMLGVTVLEKGNVDQPVVAVHVSNPSVQEAEAGG